MKALHHELALATVRQASVLDLFEMGLDTCDIARMQWRREAHVLRELSVERSRERDLPSPYPGAA